MIKTLAKTALLSPILFTASPSQARIDDFFNDALFPSFSSCENRTTSNQRLVKTKDGFLFQMALPGFDKKEVDVTLTVDNMLVIKAAKASPPETKKPQDGEETVLFDSFSRSSLSMKLSIGYDIDPQSIQATMKDGILTITMKSDPKKSAKKTIKIQ